MAKRLKSRFLRKVRKRFVPFKWEQRYVAFRHHKYYQNLRREPCERGLKPFDDKKCIFIHIPKTGGMSVANGLFGQDCLIGGHYSVDFYRRIFGDTFDVYFKFAIVRNPWDRIVSAFHFLKSGGAYEGDRIWAECHLSKYSCFKGFVRNWVTRKNVYRGIHFVPQHEFICNGNGNLLVDFVGRFEDLPRAFNDICGELGVDYSGLPLINTSRRNRDYRTYYGEREREIVARVYQKDIDLFGYEY